jgi:hypothetical protein
MNFVIPGLTRNPVKWARNARHAHVKGGRDVKRDELRELQSADHGEADGDRQGDSNAVSATLWRTRWRVPVCDG